MKKTILAGLIFLLIALALINIPAVSATTINDFRVTPGLPENIPREPMPDNFTTKDYFKTTNFYTLGTPIDEVDDPEGNNPIYVLIFGDEEYRGRPNWDYYAKFQLERGDEALVANFQIDIRILGFENWDSEDSLDTMEKLWRELEQEAGSYLCRWYEGKDWSNYVDAIIGITAQETPGDPYPIAGLTAWGATIDQGKTISLLRWQVYWADDNLVQHEISHLFYADDHYQTCCVMASHTHYQRFIWEDALWPVFSDVPCAYTSYIWDTTCSNVMNAYQSLYSSSYSNRLILRHGDPDNPKCSFLVRSGTLTEPINPGCYPFPEQITLTLEVSSIATGYDFVYWLVDGQQKIYTRSVTITINDKRTLAAYFKKHYNPPPSPPGEGRGGGGGKDSER